VPPPCAPASAAAKELSPTVEADVLAGERGDPEAFAATLKARVAALEAARAQLEKDTARASNLLASQRAEVGEAWSQFDHYPTL